MFPFAALAVINGNHARRVHEEMYEQARKRAYSMENSCEENSKPAQITVKSDDKYLYFFTQDGTCIAKSKRKEG